MTSFRHRSMEQDEPASSFLELPEDLSLYIVRGCRNSFSGLYSLLPFCKKVRDAVLQRATSVSLRMDAEHSEHSEAHDAATAADARLLNRVCTSAPPGLRLDLCVDCEDNAVPSLLQLGIDSGGWSNVHALRVSCIDGNVCYGGGRTGCDPALP
jgi:hypothetical protein